MLKFLMLSIHILILLNPTAVLSTFLALTGDESEKNRRQIALRSSAAVVLTGIMLYFSGTVIFRIFGINIDVFRIGGGVILMVCAIQLVLGTTQKKRRTQEESGSGDIAVVPIAIPMAVGPGTSAGLIIIGMGERSLPVTAGHLGAIFLAALLLCGLLMLGTRAEKVLGRRGISIITKLTGLFLSAIAAGMILEGIKNFFAAG